MFRIRLLNPIPTLILLLSLGSIASAADDPVVHWRMDQGETLEYVTLHGNPGYGPGRYQDDNSALHIESNTGQYLEADLTAANLDLSDFSLSFWAYRNAVYYDAHWLGIHMQGEPDSVSLTLRAKKLRPCIIGYSLDFSTQTRIVGDMKWNHIVLTFSKPDNKLKVYVNGSLDGTTSKSFDGVIDKIRLGRSFAADETKFDGFIDDVRMYDYVLNGSEIAALTNSGYGAARNPAPQDEDENASPSTVLVWEKSADITGSCVYDVYFNEGFATGLQKIARLGVPTCNPPGELEYGKRYFWRIDTIVNEDGIDHYYPGPVWSFSIPSPYALADTNFDAQVNLHDFTTISGNWLSDMTVFHGRTRLSGSPQPPAAADTSQPQPMSLNARTDRSQKEDIQSITVQFAPVAVEAVLNDEGLISFTCVGNDIQWLSRPGQPAIPWLVKKVLLPPRAALHTLKAGSANFSYKPLDLTGVVIPAPPIMERRGEDFIARWDHAAAIKNGQHDRLYHTDVSWPARPFRILHSGSKYRWRVAQIAVPLIKCNPVTGAISVFTGGEGELLCGERDEARFGRRNRPAAKQNRLSLRGRREIAAATANYQSMAASYDREYAAEESAPQSLDVTFSDQSQPQTLADGQRTGYVIVTTNKIKNESEKLDDFVAHKENLGFDVYVITENNYGGLGGDPTYEFYDTNYPDYPAEGMQRAIDIKAWLRANYESKNLLYVLMIGFPERYGPEAGDEPGTGVPMVHSAGHSDFYYADLTGYWNLNGDTRYGAPEDQGYDSETGRYGLDFQWELLIGRIMYYKAQKAWKPDMDFPAHYWKNGSKWEYGTYTVDWILQRTIDYENQSPEYRQYRKDVMLCMNPLDGNTQAFELGEQIKQYITDPAGWDTYRQYNNDYDTCTWPPDMTPCHAGWDVCTKVLNGMAHNSDGTFGLLVCQGHGASYKIEGFMYSSDVAQLNDDYPFFSWQAACLSGNPTDNVNLGWRLLQNGAVATVSASRNAHYYPGQTDYTGGGLLMGPAGYVFARYLIEERQTVGEAVYNIRQNCNGGYWSDRHLFNLYGDPSLYLYPPELPADLDVSGKVDLFDLSHLNNQWLDNRD